MTEQGAGPDERLRRWFCLEPVDTLFFRGGRPFDPASRAESGLPNPQVLAGALRTEMLRRAGIDLARLADLVRSGERFETAAARAGGRVGGRIAAVRFRGPFLGRGTGERDGLFYPAPATLRQTVGRQTFGCQTEGRRTAERPAGGQTGGETESETGGELVRLDPIAPHLSLPGWKPRAEGMVPLWAGTGDILKPLERTWITHRGLSDFLSGGVPSTDDLVRAEDLYGFEDRTGIAIGSDTGTADEGMIYGTRRLVLRTGVRFWAQVEGTADALDLLPERGRQRLLPFGGEARHVTVTGADGNDGPLTAAAVLAHGAQQRPEKVPEQGPKSGRCIVLVQPAFLNGWRPREPDILAAAVPGHVAVSGWDLARGGPKPTRFAVRAGSVYFLPPDAPDAPDTDAPPHGGLGDTDDTALGWGDYFEGGWFHAANP